MQNIRMVDLQKQYQRLSKEINEQMHACLDGAHFIQGQDVKDFEQELNQYLSSMYTISCGNGTDALMLACMALGLQPGDRVIVPAFTYIASVEILKLLGIEPVFCDVDDQHFMLDVQHLEEVVSADCKALIVVHLYGQPAPMEEISVWAKKRGMYVIEDNAQAIGAQSKINGEWISAGTIGDIGVTSFFPSKNLGAFGDGGALFTQNATLAKSLRMIANHGQSEKYIHDVVGVNSRLDSLQAAVLRVKLKHLNDFTAARRKVAATYDEQLKGIEGLQLPKRLNASTHVFHQYTIQLKSEAERDGLQQYLQEQKIPSVVYYPMPIYHQKPYRQEIYLPNTERLCKQVLSLPIHTEMTVEEINYICQHINEYFDGTN